MITAQDLKNRFEFIGKEKDIQCHILENIYDISIKSKWGDIERIEKQYSMGFGYGRIVADIMIWHKNKSGTLIEIKTCKNNRNDLLTAIGQVLSYGHKVKEIMGNMPRLVIASPIISNDIYQVIKTFKLPIGLLMIDGNRCVYLP